MAVLMMIRTPKDAGANSRCTISDGSVIRLPTEKPKTAQAAISSISLRELMMTASATAWLRNDSADASR